MAQRHEKKVSAVRMACLSSSPSPLSCLTSLPCCFLITSSPSRSSPSRSQTSCWAYPDPKARVQRTSAPVSKSLATWPIIPTTQVMSPSSLTRWFLRTMTRRPSTIQTTIASLTSENYTRKQWMVRCSYSVRNLCFAGYSW